MKNNHDKLDLTFISAGADLLSRCDDAAALGIQLAALVRVRHGHVEVLEKVGRIAT